MLPLFVIIDVTDQAQSAVASDGPQSEYIFSAFDTIREKSYDDKKRIWHDDALVHRVDDKNKSLAALSSYHRTKFYIALAF